MQSCLEISGLMLVGLALLHGIFPRWFRWKSELAGLSRINREIMLVHTGFIALTVFLMGLLCLTSGRDLIMSPLGRRISFGLALFWCSRLFVQFFGYSTELWKGKRFETTVHILFVLLWSWLTGVFLAAAAGCGAGTA